MEYKKKKNGAGLPRRVVLIVIILMVIWISGFGLLANAYRQRLEMERAMGSTSLDLTETKQMFDLETDMTSTRMAAQVAETNIFRTQQAAITSTPLP